MSQQCLLTSLNDDQVIQQALQCLEARIKYQSDSFTSPTTVKNYCRLQLGGEINEIFAVLFLDNQHRLLSFEKLFFGTINAAHVYPRIIIQRALALNAAAVIFTHNHPSGNATPSSNDRKMTRELKTILKMIDITVLDHVIVTHESDYSFAENDAL